MDFLEIIIRGYFNENDREALDKYFFREYKKAEKEQFYEAEQFFTGCMNEVKKLEKGISEKLYQRKNELYQMLNAAENEELTYADMEGKTLEQKHRETIEYCTKELEYIEKEGKNITPIEFGYKGMFYRINKQGLDVIATAISKAFQETQPKNEALPPQQNEKPKPELKLKDFFIKEVSNDTIEAIQTEFRELEGKDLAILIYLLHKEHKIIEILTNSKTKGRKSFVKCLTETDNPSMQGVNKCFVANTDDLIYSKDDLVFQSLNKRLTKIIKKVVV